MRNFIKKLCTAIVFIGGLASIVCLLIALVVLRSFDSGQGGSYGNLLVYGGCACAFLGWNESLIQDFWRKLDKDRRFCSRLRVCLLTSISIGTALILIYRIKMDIYNVLPEGLIVPAGWDVYSALTYGGLFLIMVMDVLYLTGAPKGDSSRINNDETVCQKDKL